VGGEPDPDADRWLVAMIRGSDVDAEEVLNRRHRDRIYRVSLRMLGNPHDAEHVAQGVIIQPWTALAWFISAATSTWLYRMVINGVESPWPRLPHPTPRPIIRRQPARTMCQVAEGPGGREHRDRLNPGRGSH
jgi:RNA polymerase sigma-70 factor (ECF subfamily)